MAQNKCHITILVQDTSTEYCKNRANCYKNMKAGTNVLHTKTIKKSKGDNRNNTVHSPPGNGGSHRMENQSFQILSHYISMDSKFCVHSDKNIRTSCPK